MFWEACTGWARWKAQESSDSRDYRKTRWSRRDLGIAAVESALVVAGLAYFFYRSALAAVPLAVVGVWFFRMKGRQLALRDRELLERQFRECIESVATSLRAGYAVENAFRESESDMRQLFGEDAMICAELARIRRGLVVNRTLEELLRDFGARSGSDAIEQFAQVFAIAKRSGGSLPEIIRNSSDLIGRQIEAKAELRAALGGKRMEQNIMNLMPFGILAYIGVANPGYFAGLYGNPTGVAIMTALLGVYLAAYGMGKRILDQLEHGI